jgi:hypothetical protein
MINTNITIASAKGASKLVRARFGPGMLLQHEDLEQLNSYTRGLSRLMFRSLFGCGVICGLEVDATPKCGKMEVRVKAGLALGCSGDPVYVPNDQIFLSDEKFDLDDVDKLWVVLCGTVNRCAPRTAICSSDDDEAPSEPTRERDGFEIRVVSEQPKCVCGCPNPGDPVSDTECKCVKPYQPGQNCYDSHYDGKCGCNCDECSDCDCKRILLAQLIKDADNEQPWRADYRVRRFIRPILMRDPQVEAKVETNAPEAAEAHGMMEAQLSELSEEKGRMEAQLSEMNEEKGRMEAQLSEMNEEKGRMKAQLSKMSEVKSRMEAQLSEMNEMYEMKKNQMAARPSEMVEEGKQGKQPKTSEEKKPNRGSKEGAKG